ncbi:hypothetical protein LWC34_54430 [Kibdelosporangium philippinense]|uniref:DUF35 domain-containing protein n=1 Tax=Kibdelosporangium philippinense TaxID=211113 RepID=A0ABS8ZY62_9PSEU|nr:hypothetical protein [Kibdelosporangium philippinense]MCE7011756.1 hypothetical protein [Kibdelosporangium philippinense]
MKRATSRYSCVVGLIRRWSAARRSQRGFEVPLFVRVELDDEYEDGRVTEVVLGLPDGSPYDGVELARDWQGHYLV